MPLQFDEPEILADFDRSFGDRHEKLVLEKGEYRGRPVYCLRLLWRNAEGQWRWSAAKPTTTGRTWAALNLKARELRALGLALIAEADELDRGGSAAPGGSQRERPRREPSRREQRELDRFDAATAEQRVDPSRSAF